VTDAIRRGTLASLDGRRLDPRDATTSEVSVNGVPTRLLDHAVVLQNKPLDAVTALTDPALRTAWSLLDGAPLHRELRPVGRLDRDTTGLLLWTDAGPLIQRLTHPKNGVERTYHAALARPFRTPTPDLTLHDGHQPHILDIDTLEAGDAHSALVIPEGTTTFARISLGSGAYHEVRRIFAALGSHVLGLCRVRYGAYSLPETLPHGGWQTVHAL
jgi:16S rRNA pseudouridine516 synthase